MDNQKVKDIVWEDKTLKFLLKFLLDPTDWLTVGFL